MIQANELRIGVYVHVVNRHGEVHLPSTTVFFKIMSIEIFNVEVLLNKKYQASSDFIRLPIKDISPVEITPEILEKCGFNWDPEENDIKGKNIPGRWEHEAYKEYPGLYYLPSYNLRYVHELQNLYFAITGKELDINL